MDDQRVALRSLSDDELRARCQDMLGQRFGVEVPHYGWLGRVIWRLLHGRLDRATIMDLALGVEVFSRAPADLRLEAVPSAR